MLVDTTKANILKSGKFITAFSLVWLAFIVLSPLSIDTLTDYVTFIVVGITGAIFANSTGAGGGVIFIPLFNFLNFSELQSVATSFAIQCFGMTAGAYTWWHHYQTQKSDLRLWQGFKRIVAVTGLAAVLGLWLVYFGELVSPSSLHNSFSWFSLLLGIFIIVSVFMVKPQRDSSKLLAIDWLMLVIIGLGGGAITAWLSVGVGELLAIYLILRRFDINMAIASAVLVSAITVWSGIWHHTVLNFQVYWQVVLFAGPGAVLGGVLAKTLVTHLSAVRLKLFFASWLLVIGVFGVST